MGQLVCFVLFCPRCHFAPFSSYASLCNPYDKARNKEHLANGARSAQGPRWRHLDTASVTILGNAQGLIGQHHFLATQQGWLQGLQVTAGAVLDSCP